MFTDRFIKIPVKIFNVKEKELTGNENTVDSWVKILPMEIIEYGPTDAEDSGEFIYTNIVLKGQEKYVAYLSIQEFENLLNNYNK